MNQAVRDAQAIQSGQITRDQLPADRKANLDAAASLAQSTPKDATQAKLDAYRSIKSDVEDLKAKLDESSKSCVMSICASHFTLAKGWGTAAAAVQAADATADAVRATKAGGPVAVAIANEWKAARSIGENAFAGGEAGGKVFGQGGLGGEGATANPGGRPSAAGGEGFSSRPPGASNGESKPGGKGSETAETISNSAKMTGKLADAALNTYRQGETRDERARRATSGEAAPEQPKTFADRGISALSGVAEGAEAYSNFNKGKTVEGAASTLKSAGNFAKAAGNEKLGEALDNVGGAVGSINKAYQNGLTAEGVSQGLQGAGSLGKLVNKDAGSAVQNVGKLVGTIGQIQSIRETEAQVLNMQAHMTDTIDQRIESLQQFQRLQEMVQMENVNRLP